MGIAAAGGVCVCIDIEHADETIAEMIKEADAEAIVTSKSLENLCKAVKDQDERIRVSLLSVPPVRTSSMLSSGPPQVTRRHRKLLKVSK